MQGEQTVCLAITIIDDELAESTEIAVICGCSPYNVTINGCITLTIKDNDSELLVFKKNCANPHPIYLETLAEQLVNIATNVCLADTW